MKILYICSDPGIPVFGRKGSSSHVRGTCLALIKLGHDVRLVCADTGGDDEGRDVIRVEEVASPESKKLGFDMRRLILDRRIRRRIVHSIRDSWRPDAVYDRYSLYSGSGGVIARRHHLPHILEVNALLSEELKDRIRLPRLARNYERRILRRAREIFVVSQPLLEDIGKIRGGTDSIEIEPMSVDTERFRDDIDSTQMRRSLGLEGKFIIGYVGTLSGWHGIRFLYDLAEALQKRGRRNFAILAIGGEAAKVEKNRELARERGLGEVIRFHGAVPHVEIPGYIACMDAGLIPDANPWNAPTKLFEYQACGVVPIGPDYPGVRSSLMDGEEGFIFPPRNIDEMVRCVEKVMEDPVLREALGRKSRERVVRSRSWNRAASNIVSHFEAQHSELRSHRPGGG